MKNIAVIGAGVMGSDVALDLAINGYEVILNDINSDSLKNAEARIKSSYRMISMTKKEVRSSSIEEIMEKIKFVSNYNNMDTVDLIIENIDEDFEKKKKVYESLDSLTKENVIYGVNTSCISITKIASLVRKPENVIGMHFMNPVPLKEIVEVVLGFHTSKNTTETIEKFLKTLNKKAILVKDYPGFAANRLSHLFMNEAAFLVQDNVADPVAIDAIFKKGYGHAMGPLETADLIGLDTVVNSLKILYESYQDNKFRCCPLLKKMVD